MSGIPLRWRLPITSTRDPPLLILESKARTARKDLHGPRMPGVRGDLVKRDMIGGRPGRAGLESLFAEGKDDLAGYQLVLDSPAWGVLVIGLESDRVVRCEILESKTDVHAVRVLRI
jgi:hypothetical protein